MSELILYTSDDGKTHLNLQVENDSVWLTQLEIAELFQTSKQKVSLHAKNIFEDGELTPAATVKKSLTVQTEGSRKVERSIDHTQQPFSWRHENGRMVRGDPRALKPQEIINVVF